jgi:predicted nucleic acid-binding protein
MSARVFVDTNVLVYSRDASEPLKQPRARAWRDMLWRTQSGRVSTQVLHELYVTLTRKLRPGLTREAARAEVRDLTFWQPVAMTTSLTTAAWELEEPFQLSFWDALIVAAAHSAGCSHLLSEDFQPGQKLGDVLVVSPFVTEPEALL